MTFVPRDVTRLVRPGNVAIIGASAARKTQGNNVIRNLRDASYPGRILPVHPTAAEIEGLPTTRAIEALPRGVDTAVVAIPASGVVAVLGELERAGVHSAMVFSNGFSPAETEAFIQFGASSEMVVHGPNCMGVLNFSDRIKLYPSTVSDKMRPGPVALIAQSGSAAISLINSTLAGLSKVVTMGSEFQVTAPDYMRWFAKDDVTSVIGIVLESIKNPAHFAEATRQVRAAGKSLVVLHVGKSEIGALAVQAHTGAMISRRDAYERFFEQCGIPAVRDYEELVASIECMATTRRVAAGPRIGIVGISGGETALATDVAADLGVPVATFSAGTEQRIRAALPGASGVNPLDLGATVNRSIEQDEVGIAAILDDPAVDSLLIIQDSQASLTPTMLGNYTPRIQSYARLGGAAQKPVVMVSPTGENAHPRVMEMMAEHRVPVLRGLRAGMVALRNLAVQPRPVAAPGHAAVSPELAAAIDAAAPGPLPPALCTRILTAYDIPTAWSVVVATKGEAVAVEKRFPLVLKITSPDIPHRSDVGGVVRGIGDIGELRTAIERMLADVRAAVPHARIVGFELQQELVDHVEAMAGFIAAPPFGALTIVGSGGTLVELDNDRVVELGRISPEHAAGMVARTRLGTRLAGYRNLMPRTDLSSIARLVSRLADLAADFSGRIVECDLNPVLIRKGSGEATVVDALLVKRD